ncbi:TPA: LysM peptidoglycan-binding domain-containing protein [Clostridioides difficile]|uniref:LysM peptidoglycan-binding domain-containing protein n=1 Tax=Clostridioides difficile TaxID=1496 RepID=UPI00038CC833|nr:LysM peptidoglycan-binding domain-containing protein [Clostridioides difficile]EGT4022985.1 LysM peptidoglycan-binding domain-containing protein [Clostridioides difficile]EQI06812.1 lysM domain protein [Clostridioides difficile Y10]MCJ0157281.1 LysM peptidoglycan-binding domain-containing protein [Clostridioides difficile]MDN9967232.1 LysM peptidoglycan-binding domain-containing protein [Clostridioides difficile]HBF1268478.1 LysM peptidoglycan-binding domain-containing protein [Clostridioid
MEIWLRQANNTFRFPVIPPFFEINGSATINTSNILSVGDIAIFGGLGLKTIELSSFFPNQEYSFCNYNGFPKPYDCVNLIESWMKEGYILRFIITETNINFECIIADFNYREQDYSRDIYFTLNLKEYRRIQISKVNINNDEKLSSEKNVPLIKGFDTKQKTHKVVEGDTLFKIAKKYYGNGDLWEKIYKANEDKIKNPSVIKNGWVLIIP